jgi:hypothetical protein
MHGLLHPQTARQQRRQVWILTEGISLGTRGVVQHGLHAWKADSPISSIYQRVGIEISLDRESEAHMVIDATAAASCPGRKT